MGAIAVLGATNTAYLTATKLFGGETACPTSGCETVLSSAYATVFGQPLALYGLLAYISMAVFALAPLAISPEQKSLRSQLEQTTWWLLFIGSTAMLLFSAYLMFIMASEFVAPYGWKAICIYCIVSALLATSLFILTLLGRAWDNLGSLIFYGFIVGLVTLLVTLGIYAPIGKPVAEGYAITSASGKVVFTVEEDSGPSEIALAQHLKEIGANMYGAYWCPHCYEQKQLFGIQALENMPYVECAEDGVDPQISLCKQTLDKAAKQTGQQAGFPTWEVKGQYYLGRQSLEDLAKASGYQGPSDFKNTN
jgi:uncharacterized membrane protein